MRIADLSVGDTLVWLRICKLCLETAPEVTRGRRESLASILEAAWTVEPSAFRDIAVEGSGVEARRRIALLLGEFDAPCLPGLAAGDLLVSDAQEDRLAGLLALRNSGTAGRRRCVGSNSARFRTHRKWWADKACRAFSTKFAPRARRR